ncbi:SDR family oxidoreductase [Persicitalea jodogahamensis]|uniref:NAD(P)-dependent oxidoreductase n=1 Tax=Persicitalea jodogahamensis TaxID=402147 RepID=A0A8J3DBG8_9BACT|nr:SDR family oxidoreductase [Persicitalea jodogahamensis]GHB72594.1 NAD(P)-dependent oxidoreductase [Persicitalea jodogahamensis]
MHRILITGATGNVGSDAIKSLHDLRLNYKLVAGVRNVEESRAKFADYDLDFVKFDFTDPATIEAALKQCDVLFLLRPPGLTDVGKYFKPLIDQAVASEVRHIVFLSVQGAPLNRFIPHHKIEKLITESGIPFTFLRPAYFMQNFTTTLREDLVERKQIFLPADNARFTLIDVRDIGAVAAQVLVRPDKYANKAFDLTSEEPLMFRQMAEKLSRGLGRTINYESPTLWEFFREKRREGYSMGLIVVMAVLHYLPRFQKTPPLSPWVEKITGSAPISFEQFVCDNSEVLSSL